MTSMTDLINAAIEARLRAYAPYSGSLVGAAILDTHGDVWTGCNVEFVSYGLCVCAERTALCKMVSEGVRGFSAVAIATRDGGTPCGMCLQSFMEFAVDPHETKVATVSESGTQNQFKLSDLIPHGFNSFDIRRT